MDGSVQRLVRLACSKCGRQGSYNAVHYWRRPLRPPGALVSPLAGFPHPPQNGCALILVHRFHETYHMSEILFGSDAV